MGAVREDFPMGATVRINLPSARAHGALAEVVGYSRDGRCVKVLRPEVRTADQYWRGFLVLVAPAESKRTKAARMIGLLGGSKGGKARARNLTPERLSEIGRAGALARWGNRPAATPKGGAK